MIWTFCVTFLDTNFRNFFRLYDKPDINTRLTVPSHLTVNVNPYDFSDKGQNKEHYQIYNYQINKSPIFKETREAFQERMNKTFKAVKNRATGNGGN